MKIGIISDTHDYIRNIQRAVREFNDKHVEIVIHAGDFTGPLRLSLLKVSNLLAYWEIMTKIFQD
jgi:predicted phosphodiesterase